MRFSPGKIMAESGVEAKRVGPRRRGPFHTEFTEGRTQRSQRWEKRGKEVEELKS